MEGALIIDIRHTRVGRGNLGKENTGHGGKIPCYLPDGIQEITRRIIGQNNRSFAMKSE